MTNLFAGVAGSDGVVPVYDPDGRWTTWSISEIYLGQQGEGKYVPKVNDYVIDPITDERWRVASLDQVTFEPVLVPIKPIFSGAFDDNDILLGVGPGTPSDTYRVYIDKSVMPYKLAVDHRLVFHGSMVASVRIFKGSLLSGNEKCISAVYDNSGNLLGNDIPLELVAKHNFENYTIRSVKVCNTTEDLKDGEIVTAVAYSPEGHVVSKRQLLAENTAFIRSLDTSVKYITGIALKSPFLSQSDPKEIQYPLNVPLSGLSLEGVVSYSDGSKLTMPVDGTKFTLFGFESFVSTIVDQEFPLVLKYSLSEGEVVYGASVASDRFITETFTGKTVKSDGAFTVKLYPYPVWVNEINGYRLEWFLYNLDRQISYNVTPHVRLNANTPSFNPTGYGLMQHLSASVNLRDVNRSYKSYVHVQTVDIMLLGMGTERTTNWTVGFDPAQSPLFGVNNHLKTTFINQNLMHVDISMDAADQAEWLERIYYATKPLTDGDREVVPPAPTHFALMVGGVGLEFPISQWNSTLIINEALPDSGTAFVKFFKRTPDNDIQLSVAGLPIYQQT
jgi:hypothetical protein